MKTIAKGDAGCTVIENYAAYEAITGCHFEFAQRIVPTGLLSQFLINKRFKEMSQQSSVCRERLGVGTEQGCSETGAGEMQHRTLDEPLQSFAMPSGNRSSRKSLSRSVTYPRLKAD